MYAELRNPVGIVTKSALIRRDIDVLQMLARDAALTSIASAASVIAELIRFAVWVTCWPLPFALRFPAICRSTALRHAALESKCYC